MAALDEEVGEGAADLVGGRDGAHQSPILEPTRWRGPTAPKTAQTHTHVRAPACRCGRCEVTGDPGRCEGTGRQGPPPLRRGCGHIAGDPAITRRGYRFYRGNGLELGGFFTRRFTLEDGRGASVSLVAGIDIETGAGLLDRCATTEEAARELQRGPGSVWAVVLTLENATVSWLELNRQLMVGDPAAFGAFAAELSELPLLDHDCCPLCAERPPARRLTTRAGA